MNNARAPHWVIPELDARGQIDSHTAMCLHATLAGFIPGNTADVIFDLRDLTAMDGDAIAHLSRADGACRARGVHLALLIGVGAPHDELAHVLQRAGLDTQSRTAGERPLPARARARRRRPRRAFSVMPRLTR